MIGICGDFICSFAYRMYVVQLHKSMNGISRTMAYQFNHSYKCGKSGCRIPFVKRNENTQKFLFVLFANGDTTIFPSIIAAPRNFKQPA